MTEWRPIVGYEASYEVSDDGQVRSLDRQVRCNTGYRLAPARILTPDITNRGYKRVTLSPDMKHKSVHALVADAFIGPCPEGLQVCHNDGDKFNNRPENLRYDTPSANVRDTIRHGTQANARKTHCPQGHLFDEANTWIRPGTNQRHCRRCHRQRENKRKQKLRAAA